MSGALTFERILAVFGSYIIAVLTASAGTTAAYFLPTVLPDDGAWGSFYRQRDSLPMFFMIGVYITFPTALPGFIAAMTVAIIFRWRRWFEYSIAGAVNVLPSFLVLKAVMGGPLFSSPGLPTACALGGFAGGFAFWLLVGHRIGGWRRQEVSR
jgi:hypothetical protein